MWPRYKCYHLYVKFLPLLPLGSSLLQWLSKPQHTWESPWELIETRCLHCVGNGYSTQKCSSKRVPSCWTWDLPWESGLPKSMRTLAPVKSTPLILKLLLRGSVSAMLMRNTFSSRLCHQHITVKGITVVLYPWRSRTQFHKRSTRYAVRSTV